MRSCLVHSLFAVVVIVFASFSWLSPARGLMIMPVNLEYMAEHADRIFLGRVVNVEDQFDSDGRWCQLITFEILEPYKGELGKTLTIKQVNPNPIPQSDGSVLTTTSFQGVPQYTVGEEVLVLLSPDSAIGYTTSVGFMQGTFRITTDADGNKQLTNGLQNIGLLKGMQATSAHSAMGLSASTFQGLQSKPGTLTLDQMRQLLGGIVSPKK